MRIAALVEEVWDTVRFSTFVGIRASASNTNVTQRGPTPYKAQQVRTTRTHWLALGALLSVACQQPEKPAVEGAAPGSAVPASASVSPSSAAADPPGFYLGRQIAPTMSHEAADWLTRPEREAEEASSRMQKELRLTPGMTACDFGAGNGFHTLVMANAVRNPHFAASAAIGAEEVYAA